VKRGSEAKRIPSSSLAPFLDSSLSFAVMVIKLIPRGTCSLSVSRPYRALDGVYHPSLGCNPKQPDSRTAIDRRRPSGPRARGSHPLRRSLPRDSEGDGSAAIASLGLQLARRPGRAIPTVGRFPLHSPLLRGSWLVSRPPPSDMLKFGG